MKTLLHGLACLLLAGVTLPARAEMTITQPWVRASVPGQRTTAAFMQLTAAQDSALRAVRTPRAASVELHRTEQVRGMMSMRPVARLALPAGQRVDIAPGGYHLMLLGLKQPLRIGEHVPLTVEIEDAHGQRTALTVDAPVLAIDAQGVEPR